MQKLLTSLLGIFLLASIAGCTTQQTENEQNVQVVKIGVILPLSGPSATYGKDELTIYQMAVNDFNVTHQEVQIQLIFEDGKCNGKDATSAIQKLIDVDKVNLVLGGLCSSEMLASAQITQPLQIVNLSAVGESPEINDIGEYVYKLLDSTNEIESLVRYLNENQVSKVGIIYENTDYATSYIKKLETLYSGEIVFKSNYASTEKDFTMLVMGLKPQLTNIEKLIIVPQSDDRFIDLRKSIDKNAGELIANTNIIGSLAIKTDNIMSSIPTLMEGLTTIFFSPYEEFGNTAIDFITNLKNIYSINSTDVYAIIFKESIDVILRAIAEGNYSSKQIQQYLRNFNAEHPIQGLWEYYFQGSVAVGLQLVPRQVKNGERIRSE